MSNLENSINIFPYSFLFCGFNIFASATFTALSNGKISAIISFSRTFWFVMVGLLMFPVILGVIGVCILVILIFIQVLCDLYLPTLMSNIINKLLKK